MAVVKGIKEKVHLPLYDSFFVRPRRQLREVESSSVLKFFANVQGKTKLETNMQSGSLLPHWNTFEARALRVVISDLPAKRPEEVEKCLTESNSALLTLTGCLDLLSQIIAEEREDGAKRLATIRECVTDWKDVVAKSGKIKQDLDECFSHFAYLSDQQTIGRILQLQSEIGSIRSDLVELIRRRTRIQVTRIKELQQFADKIEALGDVEEEKVLLRHLRGAQGCLQAFRLLVEMVTQIKHTSLEEALACVQAIEHLLQTETTRRARLDHVKTCLLDVQSQLKQQGAVRQPRAGAIRKCLQERLSNQLLIPLDEQLFGNGTEILAKLIYNSVTTLFVGEKVMIQMPTWFFPSGAGPYSEDGRAVTHGFPAPEATFRFAEPVFIDAQQNFRVEIEIPEAGTLGELQRIYGPFFIWVVLDGYMQRDVQ